MNKDEKYHIPDYDRIACKIVKVLFESGVTYAESETVIEYVHGKLLRQRVQDSD